MANFITLGKHTINLDTVVEIIDHGIFIAVRTTAPDVVGYDRDNEDKFYPSSWVIEFNNEAAEALRWYIARQFQNVLNDYLIAMQAEKWAFYFDLTPGAVKSLLLQNDWQPGQPEPTPRQLVEWAREHNIPMAAGMQTHIND